MPECQVLPIETWLHIITFLDGLTVRVVSQVSKQFHAIGNDNRLWKRLCKRNGYTERKLIHDLRYRILISDEKEPNWKRCFIQNYKLQRQNQLFDFLTHKVSDDTLFGSNWRLSISSIPSSVMICPECQEEEERDIQGPYSLLWNGGFANRVDALRHTLTSGCSLADNIRTLQIPQQFILDHLNDDLPNVKQLLILGD
jgi:hypothetical protein